MVGDQSKPRGKLTSYAFFVQICREEHKRKFPEEKVKKPFTGLALPPCSAPCPCFSCS